MPNLTKDEFLKMALDIFHDYQQNTSGSANKFCEQTKELYSKIECLPDRTLFSLEDLRWAIRNDPAFCWSIAYRDVNDQTFLERFKFTILTTKNYDFYIPIYCLYDFPSGMILANSTVKTFEDLPTRIQDFFVRKWQFRFGIDNECHHTKEEYVNLKRKSTFLYLEIKANGFNKAVEEAIIKAEESLNIIRFVYEINFSLIDVKYVVRENGDFGGPEDITRLPFCGCANYHKMYSESIDIVRNIFSKEAPNDIERRIKKAIAIFGTQESIVDKSVRFILLITCLESLLMGKSDKDYLTWRLAEKTALVLGRNTRDIYDYVKSAYDKRSDFIHGELEKTRLITDEDVSKTKHLVGDVIWVLIVEYIGKKGYSSIEKRNSTILSINEFVDEKKFGVKIDPKTKLTIGEQTNEHK
jgi:hypothetical protein